MSLLVELSGVQAAQTDIDTIGNNIANVSTAGFKGSSADFSDIYASSLIGAAGASSTPGQGVNTTSISQLFTEGTINQTGDPLNVAINGSGFFQVETPSGIAYSRSGNFSLNNQGNLVNDTGAAVMGYGPSASGSGASQSGPLSPIQISSGNIEAVPTSNLTLNVNLPSTDPVIDTTATPFSVNNASSYDESTTTSVYDSLGVSRTLTTYFSQVSGSGTPDQWATHWQLSNSDGGAVASGAGPNMVFNSAGQLTSGSGTIAINNLPNGAANLSIAANFTGSTLSNLGFGVNAVNNNGNGAGQFTGIQIASSGEITGQYSNGLTRNFGTIALANFANPQGLVPVSNNIWQASVSSGPALTSAPGTAALGVLQSGALEGSNVDLSAQLVNLIAAQQAYQANVQGISVEQQNLQRLLTVQ
ncbi:MAG TPA: flagellar hook protein FlgE [Stellaceae bacterium]|jgi:flagellar hook protein FlgE|nr:flagellar hook protein FlgE [Stellaceae bacterium]